MQFGLKPLGVAGLLLTAKSRGLVAEVKPLLDALRKKAGFYIGDAIYAEILRLAHETVD